MDCTVQIYVTVRKKKQIFAAFRTVNISRIEKGWYGYMQMYPKLQARTEDVN